MNPDVFFAEASLAMVLQVLATGLGLVLAIVCGVFLVQKKQLPTVITVAPVAVPSLLAAAIAVWSVGGIGGTEVEPALRSAAWAVGSKGGAVLFTYPVAALYLVFLAFAGAREAPRRWAWAGVGLVAVLVLAVVTWQASWNEDYAHVRAVAYGVLGIPVAVAMLSGGGEASAGREAAATAGLVLAILVATAEASEQALMAMFVIFAMPRVGLDKREEYLDRSYGAVEDMLQWEMANLVGGGLVACLAVGCALSLDRQRSLKAASGLLWLLWLPAFFTLGSVDRPALSRLAELIPAPTTSGVDATEQPNDPPE